MSEPRLRVLSLGAGVQSTTLALLAAEGKLPKPDVAIFADTGWEPRAVYEHLDRLQPVLEDAGIPLRRVIEGNIRDEAVDPAYSAHLPLFIRTSENGKGMIRRQCTANYKLKPINAEVRRLLGATVTTSPCRFCGGTGRRVSPWSVRRGNPAEGTCSICRGSAQLVHVGNPPAGAKAIQWIGFSSDEISRVAPSRAPYIESVFPLLDLDMSRADCERWLRARGWTIAKSACIGCPYHGNRQWRDLRDNHPEEWAEAVAVDEAIRDVPGAASLTGQGFLHRSMVPLAQAPIDRVTSSEWKTRQGDLLDVIADMEDGDPDGCSPYGCRSGPKVPARAGNGGPGSEPSGATGRDHPTKGTP